jgi:hypothetical protein
MATYSYWTPSGGFQTSSSPPSFSSSGEVSSSGSSGGSAPTAQAQLASVSAVPVVIPVNSSLAESMNLAAGGSQTVGGVTYTGGAAVAPSNYGASNPYNYQNVSATQSQAEVEQAKRSEELQTSAARDAASGVSSTVTFGGQSVGFVPSGGTPVGNPAVVMEVPLGTTFSDPINVGAGVGVDKAVTVEQQQAFLSLPIETAAQKEASEAESKTFVATKDIVARYNEVNDRTGKIGFIGEEKPLPLEVGKTYSIPLDEYNASESSKYVVENKIMASRLDAASLFFGKPNAMSWTPTDFSKGASLSSVPSVGLYADRSVPFDAGTVNSSVLPSRPLPFVAPAGKSISDVMNEDIVVKYDEGKGITDIWGLKDVAKMGELALVQAKYEPVAFVGGAVLFTGVGLAGGLALRAVGLSATAADLAVGAGFMGASGVSEYARTGDLGKAGSAAVGQGVLIAGTVGAVKLGGKALNALPKPIEISSVPVGEGFSVGYSAKIGDALIGSGKGGFVKTYGYPLSLELVSPEGAVSYKNFGYIQTGKVTTIIDAPLSAKSGVLAVPKASGTGTDVKVIGTSKVVEEGLFGSKTTTRPFKGKVFSQSKGAGEARLNDVPLVKGEVVKSIVYEQNVPNPEFLDPKIEYGMGFVEGDAASVVSFGKSSVDGAYYSEFGKTGDLGKASSAALGRDYTVVNYKPRTASGVDVNAGVVRDYTAVKAESPRYIEIPKSDAPVESFKSNQFVEGQTGKQVTPASKQVAPVYEMKEVALGDSIVAKPTGKELPGFDYAYAEPPVVKEGAVYRNVAVEGQAGFQAAVSSFEGGMAVGVKSGSVSPMLSAYAFESPSLSKTAYAGGMGVVSQQVLESNYASKYAYDSVSGVGESFKPQQAMVFENPLASSYRGSLASKSVSGLSAGYGSGLLSDSGYSSKLMEKTVQVNVVKSMQGQGSSYVSAFRDVNENLFEQPSKVETPYKTLNPYKEVFVNPYVETYVNPSPFIPNEVIVKPPVIPIVPSWGWPQGVFGAPVKKRKGASRGKHEYRPSLTAQILGIRGNPSKGIFEGVGGFRPMPFDRKLNKVLGKKR